MEGKGDKLLVSPLKVKLLKVLLPCFFVGIEVSQLTDEMKCLTFLDKCDCNVCTSVVSFSFCQRIKIS